jgi:hypothetical protein
VPAIVKWFGEQPGWAFEDDYLPETGTAQGAAMEFFRGMARDELRTLGVKVIEDEFPVSTYYAAEIGDGIDEANHTAEAAGFPVRFVAASDWSTDRTSV